MTFERFDPDKHQFLVEGREKCGSPAPAYSKRVYFKRARTGSGAIYLYENKAYADTPTTSASQMAFGWISTPIGSRIKLRADEGWCDWFVDNHEPHAEIKVAGMRDGHVLFWPGAIKKEYVTRGTYTDGHILQLINGEAGFGGLYGYSHDSKLLLAQDQLEELRNAMAYRKGMWQRGDHVPPGKRTVYLAKRHFNHFTPITPKEVTMTKTNASIIERGQATGSRIITANKQAAKSAAYLEAGSIANNQLAKVAGKKLPLMMRGYADTPWGKLVIANIAQQLAAEFRPDNKQLQSLTAAMTVAAYTEVIKQVNIDGMIDELLESKDIKAALAKLGNDAED